MCVLYIIMHLYVLYVCVCMFVCAHSLCVVCAGSCFRRCLQQAFHHWSRAGKIVPGVLKTLISHTDVPEHRKVRKQLTSIVFSELCI